MKTAYVAILVLAAFGWGMRFARWDAKHGADVGQRWGRYAREHILRLPPIGKVEQ